MKRKLGWNKGYLGIIFLLTLVSCGNQRTLSKIEKLPCKDLIDRVNLGPDFPETFAGRYSCEVFLADGSSQKFTTTVRSKKGEIATLSIAPLLGIELFRVNLYPDSVLFINKLDKQYYSGTYAYLSEQVGTELNLKLVQDLFAAAAIKYADSDRYKCDRTADRYVLKNIPSRKLRKALGIGKEENYDADMDSLYMNADNARKLAKAIKKDDDIFVKRYFLDGDFNLRRVIIHEVETNRFLDINYGEFINFGGILGPKEIVMEVSDPNQKLSLVIKPSKIKISDSVDETVNIPSKYERIQF